MPFQIKNILLFLGGTLSVVTWLAVSKPSTERVVKHKTILAAPAPEDSIKTKKQKKDKNRSERAVQDRFGDPFSNQESRSPMLLKNPSNITKEVTLDSNQQTYTIQEKIGDLDYRPPSTMTFDEYKQFRDREMMKEYWRVKQGGDEKDPKKSAITKNALKTLRIPVKGLEGPFGSNFVDIKPNGMVTLDFSGRWQRVNNPIIPVRQQRNGGFEFDQQISMNVVGKIGEKLKLTANWDTKATFEFQNNIKLEYTGFEEDILQKIEAGYVSMPLNSSLISGAQNLFGIKTKMQFGRMSVTTVLSSQRGKVEELRMPGGSQARDFEIKADNYDENRHFFLSQFFRNNYEFGLRGYPSLASGVKVTRVNVYTTNRVNNTQFNKNIVAYLDLGEVQPYRKELKISTLSNTAAAKMPAGDSLNKLNSFMGINVKSNTPSYRDPTLISTTLESSKGALLCDSCFTNGIDYQVITSARMLQPTEYQFNPDLGYISLNTPLSSQDVLAVAFEYSYTNPNTGQTSIYKVGEVVGDQVQSTVDSTQKMIVLKMIKPVGTRPNLPTWDLMMKNIYSLGATQVSRENFLLRVIYKDDNTGLDVPYFQDTKNRQSLIKSLGIDRLNPNNDPPADGNFDFVEGITIDSKFGRVIFPVLEPFGDHMRNVVLKSETDELKDKYTYDELYSKNKNDASLNAEKNKYFLKGKMQSSSNTDIQLPGINVAPGSVTVFAGSNQLVENQHYTIDYGLGRVKIIDQGVLASGQEIRVKYEKQDLFNFRRKTFLGTRFDFKVNNDINVGGTFLHQTESPQITRTNIGDEPSSNSIWGLDVNFKKESRFITKMLDKLPLIQTKEPSQITFGGEVAQLIPGHPKVIDKGENGTSFIDDFEGAETPFDLTRQPNRWRLSSMPIIQNNTKINAVETQTLFNEYNSKDLDHGFHRGYLSWYTIDNLFYGSNSRVPNSITTEDKENIFVKQILPQDIFPNQGFVNGQLQEPTLDLAYFPDQRGQYNYTNELTADGKVAYNKKMSWAGITRNLTNDIDFDNANIQYIEFWMMNPFSGKTDDKYKIPTNLLAQDANLPAEKRNRIPDPVKSAGKLFINLGEISEDVEKDERHFFENGLPYDDATRVKAPAKETTWGKVPTSQYITNAFPATSGTRILQDVGIDGLSNAEESAKFQSFVNAVNLKVTDPVAKNLLLSDPSADDFQYYLGDEADNQNQSILQRYLKYAGTENNSPESTNNSFTPSSSANPDNEDLNQDNTLNNTDSYWEYAIDVDRNKFTVGQNYIIGRQVDKTGVEYLQFRVPVRENAKSVGGIDGFKSIRFVRLYMTGFEEPVILRMARLQMVSNQWRVYNRTIDKSSVEGQLTEKNYITVSTVNIEENSVGQVNKTTPYVVPPGFQRDQDVTSQNYRQLNEQSLRVCAEEDPLLPSKVSGSVFKSVNYNMLNYGRIRMFIHAESTEPGIKTGELSAFIRFGTDYINNYYEVEVPLTFTNLATTGATAEQIWPAANNLDINLRAITELKAQRNGLQQSIAVPYEGYVDGRKIRIKGNPDLSSVQVLMLGIINNSQDPLSGCVWFDELRLTDFAEEGGWATTARMNVKLADLANLSGTMRYTGVGFGSIDQKVSQRQTVNTLEWGVQGNMGLDRFLPQKAGLKLPLFASYNTRVISPKYNPLDPDVLLTTALSNIPDADRRDKYRKLVVDEQIIKSISLTNVQKVKTRADAKSHFYDIENLTLSMGHNVTTRTSSSIYDYYNKIYTGGIGYNFTNPAKPIEPFKNFGFLKSSYLKLIKDFNFSYLPNTITVRGDLNRRLTKTQFYEGSPIDGLVQDPFYEKSFTFVRNYGMVWSLTKSINLNYSANTNAIIDEPNSRPDTAGYNKALWQNVKSLGRTKGFTQSVTATYKVPLDKLPITEWLGADLNYGGTYNWVAGALIQRDTMGNLLAQNTRDMGINGNISLDRLYNKSKFLKNVLNPAPKPATPIKTTDPKADTTKKEKPKPELNGLKAIVRLAMSVKRISFTYKVNEGTKLPGYKGTANVFGLDRDKGSDIMLPFVLGWQDYGTLRNLANEGLISNSKSLSDQYTYTHKQSFSAQTTLDPIRDFNITVKVNRDQTNNYSEIFHYSDSARGFVSSNPLVTGSYNVSMVFLGSAFKGMENGSKDPFSSQAFKEFADNRAIIKSRALGESNGELRDSLLGLNSQNVLIPAFISAYTGRDPNKIKLSPFPQIPLPNWSINYTGLSKVKFFKKWFTSINISHTYNASYTISSFTSSNMYASRLNPGTDPSSSPTPDVVRNSNYVPVFTMDMITIKESFSPLIGINLKTKGKASYNIQYLKDRGVSLSMANAQVQEMQSNGLTVGFAWNKTGLKLPFKWQGRQIPPLKNEAIFKVDLTVRDNRTIQRNIDGPSTITAGNMTIQLRPTISYMISSRVTMMFYFDRNVTIPYISSQYRRGVTQFGLQLRFTLS